MSTGIVFWDGITPEALAASSGGAFSGGQGPTYSANPWEVVVLGGRALPGICTIEGLPTLKIDQKKKGGSDAITFTATGYLPGPLNLSVLIWTDEQWSVFQTVAALVWRKPNKKSKAGDLAIPIAHPDMTLWGISQVIVQGVSTGAKGPFPQSKIYKFRLLEYVGNDGKNKTKTAKPAKPVAKVDPTIPGIIANAPKKPSDTPPSPAGT